MGKFPNETKAVVTVLKAHLLAVATKNVELLRKSFSLKSIFIGSDDTEQWTQHELMKLLKDSKNGWDMQKCLQRDVQHIQPNVASFFEILWHMKYGKFRGSGIAIKDKRGDWVINQYVLSFSVPNEVVDKTNILELLKST